MAWIEVTSYAVRDPLQHSNPFLSIFYKYVVYCMSLEHRVLCGCWQRCLIKISREGKKGRNILFSQLMTNFKENDSGNMVSNTQITYSVLHCGNDKGTRSVMIKENTQQH